MLTREQLADIEHQLILDIIPILMQEPPNKAFAAEYRENQVKLVLNLIKERYGFPA